MKKAEAEDACLPGGPAREPDRRPMQSRHLDIMLACRQAWVVEKDPSAL